MGLDTLDLPIISNNFNDNKKVDIQGSEIIISPTTEADLPDPIQPSIIYMEASLPSQLLSLTISKLLDYSPDPRLRQILPPPLPIRQTSVSSSSPLSTFSAEDESEQDFISQQRRKRSYTCIPIHLNPIEQQQEPPIKRSITYISSPSTSSLSSSSSKQYNCTFCQKKFMRPSSLKIHTYSHTGEKPFHCSFSNCRRRFSVQSNMRRHLRVHLN